MVMIDTDIATSWTIVICNKQEKEISIWTKNC